MYHPYTNVPTRNSAVSGDTTGNRLDMGSSIKVHGIYASLAHRCSFLLNCYGLIKCLWLC